MRAAFKLLCALTLTLMWTVMPASADVPTEMSVQGRLTNGAGAPVAAGIKLFTFKIYDAPAGGIEIWPGGPGETQALATDANGLWNAGVGELIPLTEAVFQNPVRWLEVTVNDGVNPIETLPRIELRTNPYTYRAATSEQADSLGGSSLSDLVGEFVDEPGDTMSGQLRIDRDLSPGNPNLEIDNNSLGGPPVWAYDFGTWGIGVDARSDNTAWNIGVAANTSGDNTNNIALRSRAIGNTTNYGLYSEAFGGTSNIAGFFSGDLQVSAAAGTQSVVLPDDAIDNTEILDEPGIVSAQTTLGLAFSSATPLSMVDLQTVTISIPADGYIILHGNTYVWLASAVGLNTVIYMQIDETAGGSTTLPYYRTVGCYSKPTAGNMFDVVPLERIFFKTAGSYTFRIEAMPSSIGVGATVNFFNTVFTALFVPKSYGSVVTAVASNETGDFNQISRIDASTSASGVGSTDAVAGTYQVDLRELELRAARAKAESERAQRELLEATLGTSRSPGEAPKGTPQENNR